MNTIYVDLNVDCPSSHRAYVVHKQVASLTPQERAAFEKEVQEWIKSRVARHKYLRGGVVVTQAIPKRYVQLSNNSVLKGDMG